MVWHLLLIIGAWIPILLTVVTVWFAVKLLFIPAGPYSPWRWAWRWLIIGVMSVGLLWLRNALVTTGLLTEDSWLIQLLFNLPLRLALSSLAAAAFCVCAAECYRIFQQPPMAAPIPVAQIVMSWDGHILSWNAAATELLGWTEAEVKWQELAEVLIPADLITTYQGQSIRARDAHRQGLQHFRESGESAIMDTRFLTTAQHKDGHLLEVEVHVSTHHSPMGQTFLGRIVPVPKFLV